MNTHHLRPAYERRRGGCRPTGGGGAAPEKWTSPIQNLLSLLDILFFTEFKSQNKISKIQTQQYRSKFKHHTKKELPLYIHWIRSVLLAMEAEDRFLYGELAGSIWGPVRFCFFLPSHKFDSFSFSFTICSSLDVVVEFGFGSVVNSGVIGDFWEFGL